MQKQVGPFNFFRADDSYVASRRIEAKEPFRSNLTEEDKQNLAINQTCWRKRWPKQKMTSWSAKVGRSLTKLDFFLLHITCYYQCTIFIKTILSSRRHSDQRFFLRVRLCKQKEKVSLCLCLHCCVESKAASQNDRE